MSAALLRPDHPHREQIDKFLHLVGAVTAQWNYIEAIAKLALSSFISSRRSADILIARMNSSQIIDNLRILGKETGPPELRDDLIHAMAYFDSLRTYRNFYTHNLHMFGGGIEEEAYAFAQTIRARGELQISNKKVTIDDLVSYSEMLFRLEQLVLDLVDRLYDPERKVIPARVLDFDRAVPPPIDLSYVPFPS